MEPAPMLFQEKSTAHQAGSPPPPYSGQPQHPNQVPHQMYPQPSTVHAPQSGYPQAGFYPQPTIQGPPQGYPQAGFNPQATQQGPVYQVSPAPPAPPASMQMVLAPPLGSHSARVLCPSCGNQIMTRTETKTSSKTHTWALVLCILGCWPCCLIPYCMDDCMNIQHYCSSCNTYIGLYESH